MAENWTPRVKKYLSEHGCKFERQGKGDHEIWSSPHNGGVKFMVDNKIKTRKMGEHHCEECGSSESILSENSPSIPAG